MIIQQGIQGQDTTVEFVFATGSVNVPVVNYDAISWQARKVQTPFITAQSTVTKFTNPREEVFSITIRGKRGYAETYVDLKGHMDSDDFLGVIATDLPAHTELVAKYGKAAIQEVGAEQPNEFGTYTLRIDYGSITTGYTLDT